jgi:hypothetical protein
VATETVPDPPARRSETGAHPAHDAAVAEQAVEETLVEAVDEGRRRLSRPRVALLATGTVVPLQEGEDHDAG